MKRTRLIAAILTSALCLGTYPVVSVADGIYIYVDGGSHLGPRPGISFGYRSYGPVTSFSHSYGPVTTMGSGYRLSGQNQYNLNTRPRYQDRPGYGQADYRRSGFTRFYGYPYPRYQQYRQGYRDGYRDGLRLQDRRRHHGQD